MKLSHSSISTYSDCPKKYQFKYIDKMKEKAKHYFSFGNSIHSALEFMYACEVCPSIEEVLVVYNEGWLSVGYKDLKAEEKAKKEGEGMLRDYHRKHAMGWTKPLSTEAKFDMTVDHVRLTGFIDRVDATETGGLHVIDYKTGKALDVERIDDDEQLTLYQMAVESIYPDAKVTKLTLYHVPSLTEHSAPRRSQEKVDAFKAKIVRTADAIAQGEFKETPNEKACSRCDFKPHCPAWTTGARNDTN